MSHFEFATTDPLITTPISTDDVIITSTDTSGDSGEVATDSPISTPSVIISADPSGVAATLPDPTATPVVSGLSTHCLCGSYNPGSQSFAPRRIAPLKKQIEKTPSLVLSVTTPKGLIMKWTE
ncbi:hypothetical protein Q9L58_008693 [Maublancomyces gigas]|uniref:Uncharacterized protein n=1 Tax=Discina gigas TaxID=1032678 RepID=A0ABR3G9J1_9PEZI